MRRVRFEFDPLLKVDQIKGHFIGTVTQSQIGDQSVQERRLARARLAGDQRVLSRTGAQSQLLQAFGTGTPDRHVDLCRAGGRPSCIVSGGNELKRHLDTDGFLSRLASQPHDVTEPLRRHAAIEGERQPLEGRIAPLARATFEN